jgi:hypothetical protein
MFTESGRLTDEHPLRELVCLEVLEEHSGVLDVGKTLRAGDNGVVQNLRARTVLTVETQVNQAGLTCACEHSHFVQSFG